jgi:mRNA interferase MazF
MSVDGARQGDVWWVDFGEPLGSEPGFRRPALITSSDRFNRSRIATVMVSAITSNLRLADAPGNVALVVGEAGLPKASVVNVTQTLVVDRSRLDARIGALSVLPMQAVRQGLRLLFDL